MKKATQLFHLYKKNWFRISVFLIILIAIFFRFYGYDHRWSLASDQARDAIVARVSLQNFTIPELGPFSSAGNYTTGNAWYVWLIFSTALFPFSIMTPWVVLSLAYVLVVLLMIYIGKELGGKPLGIILGLFTAVSPDQIAQSFNLTNPSLIAVLVPIALFFMLRYLRTGSSLFLFLFSFFISGAISTHFQSVYLLSLIPLVLIVKRPHIKGIFLIGLGLFIPFISYAIHDLTHGFYNYRGIMDYLRFGQYRIYIPNRWLTYAGVFWPDLVGKVLGGSSLTGYFLMGLACIATVYAILTKKMTKPLLVVLSWILITFVVLRSYRGEKYDGYFIFLHAFILILAAWTCYLLTKFNTYAGILVILVLCILSVMADFRQIANATNYTALEADYWSKLLIYKYPDKNFSMYFFKDSPPGKIIPLILYLDGYHKNDSHGFKIGFGSPHISDRGSYKRIDENNHGYELWNLNASSSAQLKQAGWVSISPKSIYNSVAKWWEK